MTLDKIALENYLKDNLRIEVRDTIEFGPQRKISIQLRLYDRVISDDCFYLKDNT